MNQVNENSVITEVLAVADKKVIAAELSFEYQAVVVEIVSEKGLEGTMLYYPGISAKELICS